MVENAICQGPGDSQTPAHFLLSGISHLGRAAAGIAGTLLSELHVRTREKSKTSHWWAEALFICLGKTESCFS